MNKKSLAAGLLGLSLAFAAGSADAKTSGVKLGVLNCNIAPGVGLIVGSSKNVSCTFRNRSGRTDRYHGSIGKIGLDLGVTGRGRAAWLVFAPGNVGRSALSGTYVGGQASASVIVGLGANVLVGGFKNNINLQPISVQGQTGLNIAVGVASLNLKAG
jgi:hypothetical protein